MDISNKYIIISYYTPLYQEYVHKLICSLNKFNLDYYIYEAEDKGSWIANCNYKPIFIRTMMNKFPDNPLVYTDADSFFLAEPVLFSEIQCDIACHHYNRQIYKPFSSSKDEILSGTLFFNNSDKSKQLVDKWIQKCEENPSMWDQKCLQEILDGNETDLPAEYCCIFDTMRSVKNPIIIHNQASRQIRHLERKGKRC